MGHRPHDAAQVLVRRGVPPGVGVVYLGEPAGLPVVEERVSSLSSLLESVAGYTVEVYAGASLDVVEALMALLLGHVYGALSLSRVELVGGQLERGFYGALGPRLTRVEARVLAGMPSRFRGLSGLAGRLRVPVSRLSVALRRLEELGLVRVTSRRPVAASLTRAGGVVAGAVRLARRGLGYA